MATVKELKDSLGLKELTATDNSERCISDGCVCDLLSWVMAKGKEDMAWITVQTNLNVIAVASLHDFSCVIIPENIDVPANTIAKADEEGITVFSSDKTSYELCRGLCSLSVGE